MDIVHVSAYGVRSVVLQLRHPDYPLIFTVYPMIHLGEQAFYDAVRERLRGHSLVVAEGVLGQDRRVRLLTLVYRLAGGQRRLGLAVQSRDVVDAGVPVVWPDISAEEFAAKWRRIPLTERLFVWTVAPLAAVFLRLFANRAFLASFMEINHETLVDEAVSNSRAIDKLLGNERDALLAVALERIHADHREQPMDVGVVYGARHVEPVVEFLRRKLGYVVRTGEWLQVFDF